MSFPPPIPAETLSYATEYVDTRRPGSLMAIGVLSIVFSIMFGLSALFSLMMAVGIAAGPRTTVRTTTSSNSFSTTTVMVGGGTVTNVANPAANLSTAFPDGIGSTARQLIVDRANALRPLSPTRVDVLSAFLAQKGDTVDHRLRTLTSSAVATQMVTQSDATAEGFDAIDFTSGRLTLEDQRAIFEPIGTTDLITVDFSSRHPLPGEAGFDPEGGPGSNRIIPTTATAPINVGKPIIVMQTLSGIFSGVLALLLLLAGILTVRAKPSGRRTHLWWAWLKIFASVFSAVATYLFWNQIISQSPSSGGQANPAAVATMASIVMSLFSFVGALLYPIAVLIVMNTRGVKNYLSSVT